MFCVICTSDFSYQIINTQIKNNYNIKFNLYLYYHRGAGYKPANKGPKDLKPPDLWIDQMELRSVDKGNRETTASVSPLPRDLPDKGMMDDDGTGIMDRRPSSFISECGGALHARFIYISLTLRTPAVPCSSHIVLILFFDSFFNFWVNGANY